MREILVREGAGLSRRGEPVRVSVPLARGEARDPGSLRLAGPEGPVAAQLQPLERWHDGSIKWLLCDFFADAAASGEVRYLLEEGEAAPPGEGVTVLPGESSWRVDTGSALFEVDALVLRPFLSVRSAGGEPLAGAGRVSLCSGGGAAGEPRVEEISLETPGPLRATLLLTGRFHEVAGEPRFSCRLHFFAMKSLLKAELTLHNPRRARHEGGLWDLGDPGSLIFRGLALEIQACRAGEAALMPEGGRAVRGGSLSLLQLASGAAGKGYALLRDGAELQRGGRATPAAWTGTGDGGVGGVIPRFWQQYPKGIAAGPERLTLSLFPEAAGPHELQGGERKRCDLLVDFSCRAEGLVPLLHPLVAAPATAAVRASGAVADLPPGRGDLVDEFLAGPEALFARREAVDEYGWRDFGDIWADHEAVYHQGEEPFLSHYNNQYDILAGMYRKFLATGDPRWGEIASDLARHVLDIDIYHTDEDREEYNGGLFWHTDHYISAGTATHRTFSKVHLDVKDPRYFGGGPAAEHCYTSGLLLHYCLTGEPESRDAVIALADWCYCSLAGPPLFLAALKRAKGYLDQLRRCDGCRPLFPRYPLTRGTGNALIATLDAFRLSGERKYLARAEELVRGALHPLDDLEARALLNAETAWSYTVLLAAVAKYLDAKLELGEKDAAFCYAKEALLAYARWMERHEYPFLEKKETLEYPNETWPAQDLRKAVVLYHAARYADKEERAPLLDKARRLAAAAREDLARFPTSSCTRPVALMLQNGWIIPALEREIPPPAADASPHPLGYGRPTARLCAKSVASRVAAEFMRALRETSPSRELAWLRARLP